MNSKFASFSDGANASNETTIHVESDGQSTTSSFVSDASEESKDKCEKQIEAVDPKEQDNFRMAFLHRLSYEKVWVPPAKRMPQHQTVIIFDWDDTLLCTSYLNHHDGDS